MKKRIIFIIIILTILFVSIVLASFVKPEFVPALSKTTTITGKFFYYVFFKLFF